MKQNALIALSMIMLSIFSFTFTSCSDDDDDEPVITNPKDDEPAITTPNNAEDAVLYKINGTSDINSIEFTEGGIYIIIKKGYSTAKGVGGGLKSKSYSSFTRSGNDDNEYIHGKYTKDGDVYTLEGFGTITVVKKENVNVTLQIQPTGKEAYTLSAQPAEKFINSDICKKLCRTWKHDRNNLVCIRDDSVRLNKTSTKFSDLLAARDSLNGVNTVKYNDPELEEVIITLSGSYITTYDDGTLAVAQWKWKNEKEGSIYYAVNSEWHEGQVIVISFNEKNELVSEWNLFYINNGLTPNIIDHITDYFTEKK